MLWRGANAEWKRLIEALVEQKQINGTQVHARREPIVFGAQLVRLAGRKDLAASGCGPVHGSGARLVNQGTHKRRNHDCAGAVDDLLGLVQGPRRLWRRMHMHVVVDMDMGDIGRDDGRSGRGNG